MKSIIYIDIGTHFAQEYNSIFGKNFSFYYIIFRRVLGYYLLRRGDKISFNDILKINFIRKELKKNKKYFLSFFVEANSKIINKTKAYQLAHGVFNCAITNNQKIDITKLYVTNNDFLSQGSSILKTKKNIELDKFVPSLGIPAKIFFKSLKKSIDSINNDYSVILRLNCEGVEDDAIYAAHSIFNKKLTLVMGSLKDVQNLKGKIEYKSLLNYMKINNLPFVFFSSSPNSWLNAHQAILNCLNNK